MASSDRRHSKLPRSAPTPVLTTPQSNPRHRPNESGGRIPRLSEGLTVTHSTRMGKDVNKSLPSAPDASTPTPLNRHKAPSKVLSASAPTRHMAKHYGGVSQFSKTELNLMGMPTRKPSPIDNTASSRRTSATPKYGNKFTVRKLRNSSPAGDGPTLRISEDAHSVIFGSAPARSRAESPPSTASSTDPDLVSLNRKNTLEILEGRRDSNADGQKPENLDYLKTFVEKASQYHSGSTLDIPERLRPIEIPMEEPVALRVTNPAVEIFPINDARPLVETDVVDGAKPALKANLIAEEVSRVSSRTSTGDNTPGLAITTPSRRVMNEHEWVASGMHPRASTKKYPVEPFPVIQPHKESLQLSDGHHSRFSESPTVEEIDPPLTPLLGPPSPTSSLKTSSADASKLVSRLPLPRSVTSPPRTDEVKSRRYATDISMSTIARKYSTVKDRRFGFRMPTKSSIALHKSTPEPSKTPATHCSMTPSKTASPLDGKHRRLPVRSLISDLVHRRKAKKDDRASSPPIPPPKPTIVCRTRAKAAPIPSRLSVRKSRTAPALMASISPVKSIEPVDRHNAAMKKAQTIRAKVRDVASRMTAGRGKLELLQATEIFNSTTTHAVAALSACERARFAALEARRFWELSLAAMTTNMGILENKIGRVGSVLGAKKRRRSF